MTVLTYEEWKQKYIKIAPEAVEGLKVNHNVDAHREVDLLVRPMYDDYVRDPEVWIKREVKQGQQENNND